MYLCWYINTDCEFKFCFVLDSYISLFNISLSNLKIKNDKLVKLSLEVNGSVSIYTHKYVSFSKDKKVNSGYWNSKL